MNYLPLSSFLLMLAVFVDAVRPLTIQPTHERFDPKNPIDLKISCSNDQPIRACQFKVDDHALIDVKAGTNVDQTVGVTFEGAVGLCTVTLPGRLFNKDNTAREVGCRVRNDVGDWRYAAMSVYSSVRRGLQLSVARREVLASPGESLDILATTTTALSSCSLLLQGAWLPLNVSACSETKHCYHGNGLPAGECGLTIKDVDEGDNGKVWLLVNDVNNMEDADLVRVIVTKPPSGVTLDYNISADKTGILTLKAWCSVIGGRPTPNITWYIAGVEIKDGVTSIPDVKWAWPEEEKTINQSLTRLLREDDNGKELRCTAFFTTKSKTESIVKNMLLYVPKIPLTINPLISRNRNPEDAQYGVAACIVFGIAIFLYIAVLTVPDLVTYAVGREWWCFKHFAHRDGSSSEDASDVMDYHVTIPTTVTLREDIRVESYLEPVQPRQEMRDSYFLPLAQDTKRVSTKAERTLGMTTQKSKAPLPAPRYDQSHKKPKQSKAALKAARESLFSPTPLSEMHREASEGTYKVTASEDETPIYGNIFPTSRNKPPLYGSCTTDPVYGNFEVIAETQPTYGNFQEEDTDDPVYGNFEVINIEPMREIGRNDVGPSEAYSNDVGSNDDSDPVYGNIYPQKR